MGWAEDQAKKISDAEEQVRKNREWQLHVNATLLTACRVAHAFNEYVGAALVTFAHCDVENQLAVAFDGRSTAKSL